MSAPPSDAMKVFERLEMMIQKPNSDNQTLANFEVKIMFNRKLLLTLATAIFLAISFLPAQAQTGGAAELKKRILEQSASGIKTQPVEGVETEERIDLQQSGIFDILDRQKQALVGGWNLTLTFTDGSQVKSILTVMPGRVEGEGTVIHSAEASLLLPSPTSNEQGVWRNNGGLQFIASYRGFAVDEKFEKPFGTIGFRHAITLDGSQESFTGQAVLEIIDTQGKVVLSENVQTRGVRQRAVAP